jgi:DNA-binding IclR family transcriptional regulator
LNNIVKNKTETHATSLIKALRVLLALQEYPEGRGVTDLARQLGLPKSAVHRLLVTFQACGFVQQQPQSSRYTLGLTLARLGLHAAEMFTPRRVARPYLEALAHEVEETVFLGMLHEASVLIVDKVEHGQVLRLSPTLGTLLPLRQTALGQVCLAGCLPAQRAALLPTLVPADSVLPPERFLASLHQELAIVAQQGFAVSIETWRPELCCLAAPIRNSRQECVAALAIALPRSHLPAAPRHDPFAGGGAALPYAPLLPALLRAAAQITAALP